MNEITITEAKGTESPELIEFIKTIFPKSRIKISEQDIVFIAKDNEKLVGFVHFRELKKRQVLQGIGVSESHRNRGIGNMLVKKALQNKGLQNQEILLKVKSTNIAAINLYQKNGFTQKTFGSVITMTKKVNN
ncbi:MAG: GNAT family N-acetyltransferase [Candidatus Micrarchaeota archaeon]